jgi:hypothetical protein
MGVLSINAASARPPGMATHHKLTKGNDMTTTGNSTCFQRHCVMKPTFFTSNNETHLSTAYYNNTTPPSYITPHSPISSLHVISDLTSLEFCWHLLFLVCLSIATFLPSHLKKKRTSKSINNTNHDQTDNHPHEYQLIGMIDYSEKQKEHTIIARDIAYWTRETFDIDPAGRRYSILQDRS